MINYEKSFIEQPVIKQSSTFLRDAFLDGENLKKTDRNISPRSF